MRVQQIRLPIQIPSIVTQTRDILLFLFLNDKFDLC
jgi:hypothetical protein